MASRKERAPQVPDLAETLEKLRDDTTYLLNETDTDHYVGMLFDCVYQVCASLADKVGQLEGQNQQLLKRMGSMREKVTHLQNKGLRGSTR